MRIQHNIMAMSAYRNYNTNTSAVAKNLEKLSSGYKINRAGDDAAGLAISEKMRAQITGLNAAQKNVKDGISLVKTAEGAMQEIQDMLNRMDYLATQSANGTYQDEVDREALQKEVNQLKDEINRIADSANFNGIKLLDGSLDSEAKKVVNEATINGLSDLGTYGNRVDPDATDKPQLHKDAGGGGKTSFDLGFGNRTLTAGDDGTFKMLLHLGAANKTAGGNAIDAAEIEVNFKGYAPGGEISSADIAKGVYDALTEKNGKKVLEINYGTDANEINIEYEVTLNDDNTLSFVMSDTGHKTAVEKAADTNLNKPVFEGNFTATVAHLKADDTTDFIGVNGTTELGTTNVVNGAANTSEKLMETYMRIDDAVIKDGQGIKVGDEYYVFAASDKTLNGEYGDNVKIVDIRDLIDEATGQLKKEADGTYSKVNGTSVQVLALSRITEAAKDNKQFKVEYPKDSDGLAFMERPDYSGSYDLTKLDGVKAAIQKFAGISANVEVTPASGKALQLQIGDTSDSFNQLKVSVGDMHTKALGIADLNIGTAESAAKAIQTIKDAINNVSSVRGDLGAYQNRLEHTANNLSVMAENIQDAESSIRDTDIAEEMMSYTKNNILVQSAQAMLAQANQVPQGVLQLLG